MKQELLNEYKGKNIVFVAYNKSKSDSVRELDKTAASLTALGRDDIALLCIDVDTDQADYSEWFRFSSVRSGEHYAAMFNNLELIFKGKYNLRSSGCYYEVYSPEGQCTVSTSDSGKVINAIVGK